MAVYGYARVSNKVQNIERQLRNLQEYDRTMKIYQEVYTGTVETRPEWQKLLKRVKPGDTIVFDSVSRMSRNSAEGVATYISLYEKGVSLVFLKEPTIDTATYQQALNGSISMTGTDVDLILEGINRYMLRLAEEQIKKAFDQSEKEVEDLHIRTKEGLVTARKNGKTLGRRKGTKIITDKEKNAKNRILKDAKDFGGAYSDKDLIVLLGISVGTYYKYKKELRLQNQIEGQQRLKV